MRYYCYFCNKSVTTEVPDDTVVRAILVCPECIEVGKINIPEREPQQLSFDFERDINANNE